MSFFGFDSSLPGPGSRKTRGGNRRGAQRAHDADKELDFEDSYRGLGDHDLEEEDFLNTETFGDDIELGTDFDFGHKGSDVAAIESNPAAPQAQARQQPMSYASVASQGAVGSQGLSAAAVDVSSHLKTMDSVWGSSPQQQPHVMSMEEIERQQRQIHLANSQAMMNSQVSNPGSAVPPPPGSAPMMMPFGNNPYMTTYPMQFPPMFAQQPNANSQAPPPGIIPPGAPSGVYAPQQQQQQLPHQQLVQQQMHQPQQVQSIQQSQQIQHPQQVPQQQVPQQQSQPQQPILPQGQQVQQQSPPANLTAPLISRNIDSHQASASPANLEKTSSPANRANTYQSEPKVMDKMNRMHANRRSNNGQYNGRREPMSQEEQKRLQLRHSKVERILKHSGLMTPRDKDFITRYQLSQIVTEDPYNEDFYFQVFKIIQRGGIGGESNKGMIARAYLEHSGHRLGGRYKRTDIALQRMQSQVEKAVTVAKERPQKNKDYDTVREGVLGKISSNLNGKAPRRQLQIPAYRGSGPEDLNEDGLPNVGTPELVKMTESLGNVEISSKSRTRRRSSYAFSSVDHNSVLTRSGGRKFVLSLIESVYEKVLKLEADLRNNQPIDSTLLWESLHIDDDVYEVSPFISMLSFDKGIKIMPRIFNFLEREQKLKMLQTFFSELSHLNIIIISSYKTNPNPSVTQVKKMDHFQKVFLKIIVSFLSSSSNFVEIMGLLLNLIKNNNVSFISTSKIGLNLITVLISRAALIRQDSNRTNTLSSAEISTWNEIYDKLFTALESKIVSVFPTKEYTDRLLQVYLSSSMQQLGVAPILNQFYDKSYIWQFLASLALSGKLNHQRIIIDEVRDQIFGTIDEAESVGKSQVGDPATNLYRKEKLYQDLNLFLNVMGLVSRDGEITEFK